MKALLICVGTLLWAGAAAAWDITPGICIDSRPGSFQRPIFATAGQFEGGGVTFDPRLGGGFYDPPLDDNYSEETEEHYNYVIASVTGRRSLGAGSLAPWVGLRFDFTRSYTKYDRDTFYSNGNANEQHDDYTTCGYYPFLAAGVAGRSKSGDAEIVFGGGAGPGFTARRGTHTREFILFDIFDRERTIYNNTVVSLEGYAAATLRLRITRQLGMRVDLEGQNRLAKIHDEPYDEKPGGVVIAIGPTLIF